MARIINIGVEQRPRIIFSLEIGADIPDVLRLHDGSFIVLQGQHPNTDHPDWYEYKRCGVKPLPASVQVTELP